MNNNLYRMNLAIFARAPFAFVRSSELLNLAHLSKVFSWGRTGPLKGSFSANGPFAERKNRGQMKGRGATRTNNFQMINIQ